MLAAFEIVVQPNNSWGAEYLLPFPNVKIIKCELYSKQEG